MIKKKMVGLTKDEICKRLEDIAIMLDREYTLEGLKTTRAIYQAVRELHNELKDKGVSALPTLNGWVSLAH
jgi:flagellar biosynthesis regulator FlbT